MNRLILPGIIPSVNTMYKHKWIKGRKFQIYTDTAAAWEEEAILRTKQWKALNGWNETAGKVYVRIWIYWPDNKRRDTHNCLKALLDALERAHVYTDDRTALPQIMDYEVDKKNPRCEIEFELYG